MTVSRKPVELRNILGVDVADYTEQEVIEFIGACIEHARFQPVAFLNANNANITWANAKAAHAYANHVVVSDGIGVDLAAKLLHGSKFRANLNGTDLIPALLTAANSPLKVGLFGSKPGVPDRAALAFAAIDDRHEYRVISHGYVGPEENGRILSDLKEFKPDILLVALGVPRQEIWVAEHLTSKHCTVPISVGALFDLTTGEVSRAPEWVRIIRSEWVYRLAMEPKRLWRRYIVGNPVFLKRAVRQKFGATPPWSDA
ncbi:MAG: WecB/TagA/CpsF family glycosyltransferase [Pseudomonadota bacterium]